MHFLRENLFVFLFRFIINVVNFQGVEEFFTLVFQGNQFVKLLKFVRFFLVETIINCVVYTLFLLKKFLLQDHFSLFFKSVHRALILVFKLSILLFDQLIDEQIMGAPLINLIVILVTESMPVGELLLYCAILDPPNYLG